MTFATLALVVLAGLLGPLLSGRASWHIPVVVGELLAGLVVGISGFHLVDPADPTGAFLAEIGFGLTMVVIGSHVPVRDRAVRSAVGRGLAGAVAVGALAAALGAGIAAVFGSGHAALYAVLLASSSAALVLPMLQGLGISVRAVPRLVAQIAVADTACIIALPLVMEPSRVLVTALGALAVIALAAAVGFGVHLIGRRGRWERIHDFSERRRFALELRVSLLVLFSLAAIAQLTHVSVMLAGFSVGLMLAAIGEPRRLARQLFGMTEGFFAPLFFVWLGASIDLRQLTEHPQMIVLGVVLGAGACVAHMAARAAGLPWVQAIVACGQLGVPVAAVALGIRTGALLPGEGAAILLGALVTVVIATCAAAIGARRGGAAPADRNGAPAGGVA